MRPHLVRTEKTREKEKNAAVPQFANFFMATPAIDESRFPGVSFVNGIDTNVVMAKAAPATYNLRFPGVSYVTGVDASMTRFTVWLDGVVDASELHDDFRPASKMQGMPPTGFSIDHSAAATVTFSVCETPGGLSIGITHVPSS